MIEGKKETEEQETPLIGIEFLKFREEILLQFKRSEVRTIRFGWGFGSFNIGLALVLYSFRFTFPPSVWEFYMGVIFLLLGFFIIPSSSNNSWETLARKILRKIFKKSA